jgi:hypothetical protein
MDVGAPSGTTLYALTPVPANTAVAAKEVHDPRGSDLMETYLEAEDGALQPVSAYDPARKSDCTPIAGVLEDRCAPTNVAYVSSGIQFWTDKDCMTSRLAARFGCVNTMPVAVSLRLTKQDACGDVTLMTSYAEIGAETSAASFVTSGLACSPNAQKAPNPRLYAVGAAIAKSTMPMVGTVDAGAGRIKIRYQADGEGHKIHAAYLYDSMRKEICYAQPTANGLRCIPNAETISSFSDDMCTKPLLFANTAMASCPERKPPPFAITGGWTACNNEVTPVRYFAAGARLQTAMVHYGNDTCSAPVGTSGVDFYDSTEVPVTEFAPLEDVTE